MEICFDPRDRSSLLDGNSNIIEEYNEFEKMLDGWSKSDEDGKEKSKWILILNMNKNQMLDKNMILLYNSHLNQTGCLKFFLSSLSQITFFSNFTPLDFKFFSISSF